MRRQKAPKPATQEELNTIQDEYRDQRADIGDLFMEARRVEDNARAARLWEYWKYLRIAEFETTRAAVLGIPVSV